MCTALGMSGKLRSEGLCMACEIEQTTIRHQQRLHPLLFLKSGVGSLMAPINEKV